MSNFKEKESRVVSELQRILLEEFKSKTLELVPNYKSVEITAGSDYFNDGDTAYPKISYPNIQYQDGSIEGDWSVDEKLHNSFSELTNATIFAFGRGLNSTIKFYRDNDLVDIEVGVGME